MLVLVGFPRSPRQLHTVFWNSINSTGESVLKRFGRIPLGNCLDPVLFTFPCQGVTPDGSTCHPDLPPWLLCFLGVTPKEVGAMHCALGDSASEMPTQKEPEAAKAAHHEMTTGWLQAL